MSYHIELHPLAIDEMELTYQWYETLATGLGERFLAAAQKKFEIISATPDVYAKKKGNYREAIPDKFPYAVIYEILEKQKIIFISYVFHTKRNPRLKYKR